MLSFPQNIPTILEFAAQALISGSNCVCDIGCGMGKYGLLIKERYLSIMAETLITPTWDKRLIAIEDNSFFYDNSPLDRIYDKTYNCSALQYPWPTADVYLLIDIVEHWSRHALGRSLANVKGTVLVSTPKECSMYTKHYYGDNRVHCTQYTEKDFEGWQELSTPLSHIYVRTT